MKVLFVLHSGNVDEGSGKAFLRFLPLLMERSVEPLVVLPPRGGLYDVLLQNHVPTAELKYNYRMAVYPPVLSMHDKWLFLPRLLGRCGVNIAAVIQLLGIAKQFKPDIIHTNSSVCTIGYHVSRLLHIKHIWHIREYGALDFHYYYYYPSRRWQLHRYRKNGSYTLCITKDIQRYNQLEHYDKSRVVYDGVLPENAIIYNPMKQKYLLFVGRLAKEKGVLPLLEAYIKYKQCCPRPLPLWLVGASGGETYMNGVYKLIEQHNLSNNVRLFGPRQDVLKFYSEAIALVVPSLSEGFGFITAEAMFSGCLVVGNDVAGTKEQFDNGCAITGEDIALRYRSQEQLVQHLLDITEAVENDTFTINYEPMILRAQKVVKKLYTAERNAGQIYQFYQSILCN